MFRLVVCSLCCWFGICGKNNLAVGQVKREVNDLIGRMAAEREQIIQYVVRCRVEGSLGELTGLSSGWIPKNDAETEVYYEFSRIDQHYVTAVRNLKNAPDVWYLRGTSGSVGLSGKTGSAIEIRDLNSAANRNFLRTDQRHSPLLLFDPMAIGLVFCGDFRTGLTFEAQIAGFLDSPPDLAHSIQHDKNGIVTWTSNTDTTIVIDTKRSHWPLSLDYNRGNITWDIQLGKYKDFDVPLSATLKCKVGRTERYDVTKIKFQWERINEPVSVGHDCIPRIGKLLGM